MEEREKKRMKTKWGKKGTVLTVVMIYYKNNEKH